MRGTKIMKRKIRINFMTLFLLFGTVFMGVSAVMNVAKCISYSVKTYQLKEMYNNALVKNEKLKSEIESYKSQDKYINFAINYLGYAPPNSIKVVLVKNSEPSAKDEKIELLENHEKYRHICPYY